MTVWNDILANPSNLQSLLRKHLSGDQSILEDAAELIYHSGRVVFTGIGSGMNATIPACYYLVSRGFPAQYQDTTEAAYPLFPSLRGNAVVLNTRSGETAELVRLALLARENHIPTVAVTNEPGSQVGRLANICIPTHSRWDTLVVISAYLGMAATELLLAGKVAELFTPGAFNHMADELQRAAENMEEILNQVIAQRQELLTAVQDAPVLYLLARGPSLASAIGGSLVIQETCRRHVFAMPTGLFRQGPIEVVDEHFYAIMFEGCGETASLNYRLAQELIEHQAKIIWVGGTHLQGALNVPMPDFSEYILPLFEILPTQVLAHDLAIHDGITPGEVRYIQAVITKEEGIQSSGQTGE